LNEIMHKHTMTDPSVEIDAVSLLS
jgi:hypothetical protein